MVDRPSEKLCFSSATAISERKSYRAEGKQLFEFLFLKPAAPIKAPCTLRICSIVLTSARSPFRTEILLIAQRFPGAHPSLVSSMVSVPVRVEFDAVFHETWIDIRDGCVRGVLLPGGRTPIIEE